MKHLLFLSLLILTSPLGAGPYCMDNSEHLTQSNDTKEWHPVRCFCDCATIKGNLCIDCGHLQITPPVVIPKSTKMSITRAQRPTYLPEDPQDTLKKLATQYSLRNN